MKLSVIVPCLNEAGILVGSLAALVPLRGAGKELIVVDGGRDESFVELARQTGIQIETEGK